MLASIRNLSFLCVGLLSACSVKLPEGKFKCSTDKDCPSDWVCADSLCYSERPMGVGDGGQGNGADAAMSDAGGDDFDAGINTTDCDAFTTFYRDSDDDGLGNATQSIAACSVMNGYVTNQDDCNDMCTACTKPDVEEICDGYDNECDGRVDDGQLKFSTRVSFDALPNSPWVESVPVAGGAIMFSQVTQSATATIVAQRFSSEGAPIGEAVTIAGAVPAGATNLAADVLEGKIVLAWLESDGVKATVLKASDLSVLVEEKKIDDVGSISPALDVAVSSSGSGGRVMFAYEQARGIEVQGHKLSDLSLDTPNTVIYTPSDAANALPLVTLAAAPCLSGFYAAVLDEFLRVLRVIPLGSNGMPAGTSYDVPMVGDNYFTALPALRVEGGSCDEVPSRLVLSYSISTDLIGADTSDVHLDYLAIERDSGLDTISLANSASFEQAGAVLLGYYFTPGGYIFIARALDFMPYDGRYLVAVASASALDSDVASLDIAEIDISDVVGKYKASDIAPVGPKSIQLLNLDGKAWLGTSFWSNQDPGGLLRIGCAPAP